MIYAGQPSRMHRRDRVALVLLRLCVGGLALQAGVQLLRNAYGRQQMDDFIVHLLSQPIISPDLMKALSWLAAYSTALPAALMAVHLLAGLLLIFGLLSRSSALLLGLTYGALALVNPAVLPILFGLACFALSLSDAGETFSLQGYSRSTQAQNQAPETD
ncbi:MAG: DoxX family membrane protein [Myxococcota bacterium]|nr:DoxX family membrane protein [Myxococcota bacterium]